MIYLDAATTVQPDEETIDLLASYAKSFWGNVSGAHQVSRGAKNLLEQSRENLSDCLGCNPDQVIFTSGATEALNIVIQGYIRKSPNAKIFYSAIEHAAVLNTVEFLEKSGHETQEISVDANGIFNLDFMKDVSQGDLVCIMPVNNETGVANDVISLASDIHSKGARVLFDCVQSFYSFNPEELVRYSDFAVFSGHKLGSPQGVGFLVAKDRKSLASLSFGGSQEWEMRPGTMPAALVAVFVSVFAQNLKNRTENIAYMQDCRSLCEDVLGESQSIIEIYSHQVNRSPHIVSFSTGVESQMLVAMIDKLGVCVSRGSACASGAAQPSRVLMAMGVDKKQALSTLRLSFSPSTTLDEVSQGTQMVMDCVNQLVQKTKETV